MKRIIVMIMALLPLCMVAQELKIAVVNYMAVINVMPETSNFENEMAALRKQYETHMKGLQDDYTRKNQELIAQQDSLTENIYKLRVQEIQELMTRMENLQQVAQQDMQDKQEKLLTPIREKIQKAIDQVGEENSYTLIINPEAILYMGKSAVDATDKVKAKLGIK